VTGVTVFRNKRVMDSLVSVVDKEKKERRLALEAHEAATAAAAAAAFVAVAAAAMAATAAGAIADPTNSSSATSAVAAAQLPAPSTQMSAKQVRHCLEAHLGLSKDAMLDIKNELKVAVRVLWTVSGAATDVASAREAAEKSATSWLDSRPAVTFLETSPEVAGAAGGAATGAAADTDVPIDRILYPVVVALLVDPDQLGSASPPDPAVLQARLEAHFRLRAGALTPSLERKGDCVDLTFVSDVLLSYVRYMQNANAS
jgi:hypothetical protein